jgi:enoyl-CoA hydratase
MAELVTYELEQGVATIALDDGKVNVLSPGMLAAINGALDRALEDGAVVTLTGRSAVFSAGFDLATLRAGGQGAVDMVRAGFELAERVLSLPTPVVIACPGHAVAMASFLLLTGDYRLGTSGPYRITANEVAIGLTMPHAAIEICRQRLTAAMLNRALILAEVFSPEDAVTAGFLDRVVPAADLASAATEAARTLAQLDRRALAATKQRLRAPALRAIRAAIEADASGLESPAPAEAT